jgi:predicted MFS family arabinose efflux permease
MQNSSLNVPVFAVGIGLVTFCGGILGNHLGTSAGYSALVAGFAVGLILITQSYVFPLKSRIEQLERRLQNYDQRANA